MSRLKLVVVSVLWLAACGKDDAPQTSGAWGTDEPADDDDSDDDTPDDDDASGDSDTTDPTDDPLTSSGTDPTGQSSSGGPTGGPAGTCGMGGTKSSVVQVELGSPERWYYIGAPDTDEPLPLVLAFHGDEGHPDMSTRWIWGAYWEQNNLPFITVMTKCPGCTSWYMGDTSANADYVWEVLADVAANHNVDVSRIYAVGYSGGSEFLGIHGWEFQDVFAGIQWTCGGGAWTPYTPPSRDDCKVHGRIVISADDFLWDGSQALLQRLMDQGHPHEFVEAQCSGHCCDTADHNEGAWAWFQTVTKCGAEVPGECAELSDLPPAAYVGERRVRAAPPPSPVDFEGARDRLDVILADLEAGHDTEGLFEEAMAAYDTMLAAAHRVGPDAKAELTARYPRLRAAMARLRR